MVGKRPRKQVPRRPDYHVPMSGLGEFLRGSAAAFPAHAGYLAANPSRRLHWRTRLTALGPGLRVGISWRGGTDRTDRRLRSIPLEQWQPILRLPGVRFVSLQYGDCRQEVEAMRAKGVSIVHWQEPVDDLDECAALLCELDLVVSVTTTVIHLAGALARPVWVLVPARPGWRYLLEGERLPWYPSARLWRQAETPRLGPGDRAHRAGYCAFSALSLASMRSTYSIAGPWPWRAARTSQPNASCGSGFTICPSM